MMAPKPHAKPKRHANRIACGGDALRTWTNPGTVDNTITMGRMTQGTSITMAHTFSHGHWPRYLMGKVKMPFMMPETMAHAMPNTKTDAEKCMDSYSEFKRVCAMSQGLQGASFDFSASDQHGLNFQCVRSRIPFEDDQVGVGANVQGTVASHEAARVLCRHLNRATQRDTIEGSGVRDADGQRAIRASKKAAAGGADDAAIGGHLHGTAN